MNDWLHVLSEQECRWLLEQAHIGRVAVNVDGVPAIFPVNYGLLEGDVVFMTGEGTKLRAAVRNATVAFEIDGHDTRTHSGWSVVVVGATSELTSAQLQDAGRLRLEPWAGGDRDHVVRISPDSITGRRLERFPARPT
jgi:uncharacterized protein